MVISYRDLVIKKNFSIQFVRTAVCPRQMSSKKAGKLIPKLHAVTLIRSGIGRPHWEKKTLKVLKLTKMHKTVIHKNTPTMNGHLASVKDLIQVRPVVLRTDLKNSPNGGDFYQDNGHFFIDEVPPEPPVSKSQES